MTLSLSTLRSELREHLGVDDSELIDAEADLLLNRSWWEIADKFNFREKESSVTVATVADTREVPLPVDAEALQFAAIEHPVNGQRFPLYPMDFEDYERSYSVEVRSRPTHYVRRGSEIILYPTPGQAYSVTYHYWTTLADIASGGVTVPQAWHEIILYGAVWRGFARAGDWNRRTAAKATQVELVETMETVPTKEKENRQLSGVQVIRPGYR